MKQLKIKKEYLDLRFSFNGTDHIARFVDPLLYPYLYKRGLEFIFEEEKPKNKKEQ